MAVRPLLLIAALLMGAAGLAGCGDSEIGSAPVVKVSPEQRAKDQNAQAESTVKWLEGLSPEKRKAALARSPQIKDKLSGATDPALKGRIAALGL